MPLPYFPNLVRKIPRMIREKNNIPSYQYFPYFFLLKDHLIEHITRPGLRPPSFFLLHFLSRIYTAFPEAIFGLSN